MYEEGSNQEPREDKEDIDTEKTSSEARDASVEEENQQDAERSHTIESGAVSQASGVVGNRVTLHKRDS